MVELIDNEKKSRVLNFIREPQQNPDSDSEEEAPTKLPVSKIQQAIASAPCVDGGKQSGLGGNGGVRKKTVYGGRKDPDGDYSGRHGVAAGKHLFNWEILNKSKYAGSGDKYQTPGKPVVPSPGIVLRKGVKLDSLQYNPAMNLPPVNEEDVRQHAVNVNQPQQKAKKKRLSRIDINQLSVAARVQQNSEYEMVPAKEVRKLSPINKGRLAMPKPSFSKLPSMYNRSGEDGAEN